MKLLNLLLIASIASSWVCAKREIFVVERESESLATIYNGVKKNKYRRYAQHESWCCEI